MKELISQQEKKAMFSTRNPDSLYKLIYLQDVEPYIFKDFDNSSEKYFEFLYDAANLLEVSPHNVMIAGSARLGFSLNPSPQKERFLKDFNEDSDIDLVVVSPFLFQKFTREFTNAYYKIGELNKKNELGKKVLKGFFDFYHFTDINHEYLEWSKKTGSFQKNLQKTFDFHYEINYRIFNDWLSVELYYKNSIVKAQSILDQSEGIE